jgi:hypothetical protein
VPARPSGKNSLKRRHSEIKNVKRREMQRAKKVSRVLLHSIRILNLDIKLERAAFGKNFDAKMW